jgi:polysaccharide export outer membrane protein
MAFTLLRRPAALVSHCVCLATAVCLSVHLRGQEPEYLIGPRDVLAVTVTNQPTLSGKFIVAADGSMTYPLLGTVRVGALSLRAVERQLTKRLAEGLLKNPIVSVALDQAASQHVVVTGEVRQAGSYPLSGRTTVLEALLKAGVLTETAGTSDILIVRTPAATDGSGTPTILHVSLDALQRGDVAQNVSLLPGDLVFVPRSEAALPVYVTGQVKTPGAHQLPKGATVLQALAQAGGVTDRGSTKRITLIRKVGDRNVESKVALHDTVQAGDSIVVGRRLF